jgi:acyl-CoA reductase-like NAD-dependent aldehyde dehydrogenase
MHQGQICMSTERVIVDESIADEFVKRFAARAKSLPSGDPRRNDVVLGSLISVAAAERIDMLADDAVAKGAAKVAGGKRNGAIMDAIVLDKVAPGMKIYAEESFGPITTVVRVRGVEEAILVANDTEYGLSASVYGRDVRRALEVAKRIHSGICHVNGPTVADEAQMPFGGVKASGYGRFGGKAGIAEFTDLRWITIEDPNQPYPF